MGHLASRLPCIPNMKTNTQILRRVMHLMNIGRPLWAMLTINEYLNHEDPLRRAFINQASRHLNELELSQTIIVAAANGSRLAELEASLQEEARNFDGTFIKRSETFATRKERPLPTIVRRQVTGRRPIPQRMRRALRAAI